MHNSLMCAQFPIKFIIFLMSLSLLLPLQRKKRNPSLRKIPHEPTTNKKMVVYPLKYCINDEIEIKVYKCLINVLKHFEYRVFGKSFQLKIKLSCF